MSLRTRQNHHRNCAHPDYRPLSRDYDALAGSIAFPADDSPAFSMHLAFVETGDMHTVKWAMA